MQHANTYIVLCKIIFENKLITVYLRVKLGYIHHNHLQTYYNNEYYCNLLFTDY